MMKTLSTLATTSLLLLSTAPYAQDQSNFSFDGGSVIIHCAAPTKEAQISSEIFNEAFPLWITNLQVEANEGRVARAHYLSELKQGIFVVVIGEDKEAAMTNALAIQAENKKILIEAMSATYKEGSEMYFQDVCQLIEIGPVAIQPMK